MADQPIPTKLKKNKSPHCNYCQRDLKYIRVLGSERTNDINLARFEFDITIDKGVANAQIGSLQRNDFNNTPNPRKFLAELEMWIEDEATEVHCPYCLHAVQLARVAIPQPEPPAPGGQPLNSNQNTLLQAIQAAQGQGGGGMFRLGNSSTTFGQNRSTIQAIFDQRFTDQEMIDALTDVDEPPAPGTGHSDLVQLFTDHFYG